MSVMDNDFLGTAFRAAMLAGQVVLENRGKITGSDIDAKQASDFVTRVDRESEEIIISTIKKRFPDHDILAEETIHDPPSGDFRWIIDPLDGTTNYIHGYPVFAISIALEYKGEIILGLIFDPEKDEVFTAEKNRGAFLNGRRIHVSRTEPDRALITTGFPFRKKQYIKEYLQIFERIFQWSSDIRRAGSAAIDLAYLACGRCEGFFEIGLSPWDIAAGSLLIKEAGGVITDFKGGNEYLWSGNIVAGTPEIHPRLLKDIMEITYGSL